MTRTKEEISNAVTLLRENKSKCYKFNFFGENNHIKIDALIDTIENERSEDYVYANYPSQDEEGEEDSELHSIWQSAISGLEFLKGKIEVKDLLYPEINKNLL